MKRTAEEIFRDALALPAEVRAAPGKSDQELVIQPLPEPGPIELLTPRGGRGPRGALWSPSTIHGNPERGIGILHNELYIGRLVWNRQRFLKDPDTGKRVARANPPTEWITKDVPELRVVDDEVWQAVQTRYVGVQRKWKAGQEGKR